MGNTIDCRLRGLVYGHIAIVRVFMVAVHILAVPIVKNIIVFCNNKSEEKGDNIWNLSTESTDTVFPHMSD